MYDMSFIRFVVFHELIVGHESYQQLIKLIFCVQFHILLSVENAYLISDTKGIRFVDWTEGV